MHILICGGNDFNDWNTFKLSLDRLSSFQERSDIWVVSRHTDGADRMGERYAAMRKWQCRILPQTEATVIRDAELIDYIDAMVIFWDGKSSNERRLIELAKLARRFIVVFDYYGNVKENFVPSHYYG